MKLIIQIPCFNEAETLARTLAELPESIPGIDCREILVIDDGSQDGTAEIARKCGVDHVVSHKKNLGLARAFVTGLAASIAEGADIIVNTDADNQYCADDIGKLIQPILEGRADIVVGARPITEIEHFSRVKKVLQRLGSWVIRVVSNTRIPDAPSGFRAFSREAAMRLNVFSSYTYTLETIIQAGQKNMAITSVPVRVNPELRQSRLVKSNFNYVFRSAGTAIRIFLTYRPLFFFFVIGISVLLFGSLLGARFLYFYFTGDGDGHIQSLILAALLISIGFQTLALGVHADLTAVNRVLLEKIDERLHRHDLRIESSGPKESA